MTPPAASSAGNPSKPNKRVNLGRVSLPVTVFDGMLDV